jgi:dihydroxyacetone kinase-like protein
MTTTQRTKKLLNAPDDALEESLRGFGLANSPLVNVDPKRQLVIRRDAPVQGKVGVLSGGGSGHEPLDSGYVGRGMLDAAVLGSIFTCPSPDRIVEATQAIDGGAGVLYIVKNYTGDVMNFRLAAERVRATGTEVEIVFVTDDVAVNDAGGIGRRGTGATVLAQRLAGAAAEKGASLSEVTEIARRVVDHSGSFGVALTSCSTLALGRPSFVLGEDEIELGVGIHGEPGRRRGQMMTSWQLVAESVEAIVSALEPPDGATMLAFVNGFGATPLMELYVVYNDLVAELTRRGYEVRRSLVGNYVTSLDMAGTSITLLVLDGDDLTALWDAPVRTVGLSWGETGGQE